MCQLTTACPRDSHVHQKLTYKQGLWVVQGAVLPHTERPDCHTVISLVPTEQSLNACVSSAVRMARSHNAQLLAKRVILMACDCARDCGGIVWLPCSAVYTHANGRRTARPAVLCR